MMGTKNFLKDLLNFFLLLDVHYRKIVAYAMWWDISLAYTGKAYKSVCKHTLQSVCQHTTVKFST